VLRKLKEDKAKGIGLFADSSSMPRLGGIDQQMPVIYSNNGFYRQVPTSQSYQSTITNQTEQVTENKITSKPIYTQLEETEISVLRLSSPTKSKEDIKSKYEIQRIKRGEITWD
jgi:hypothetical protein